MPDKNFTEIVKQVAIIIVVVGVIMTFFSINAKLNEINGHLINIQNKLHENEGNTE